MMAILLYRCLIVDHNTPAVLKHGLSKHNERSFLGEVAKADGHHQFLKKLH